MIILCSQCGDYVFLINQRFASPINMTEEVAKIIAIHS